MRKIAVLTDSACDIPAELQEKYNIDIMSFVITLDDKSYRERQDFDCDEYYKMLREAKGVPSTAHITAIQFCEQYCKYVDEGYTDVLHVTINASGSATYDAAVMAANMLKEERPESNLNIRLVDSHTYSFVYGYQICEAARRLQNGADLDYVVEEMEKALASAEVVLTAFSLKQMKKSGRISAAAAFAGELLGLRPIITLIDGESSVQAKVRGDAQAAPAMLKLVKERMDDEDAQYMIGCTDTEHVKELEKLCRKEFGHPPVCVFKLGAAVSSNTGPDAMAVAYRGKRRR